MRHADDEPQAIVHPSSRFPLRFSPWLSQWNCELESGSSALARLHPDAAAVSLHQSPTDHQTEPDSFGLDSILQPAEWFKQRFFGLQVRFPRHGP